MVFPLQADSDLDPLHVETWVFELLSQCAVRAVPRRGTAFYHLPAFDGHAGKGNPDLSDGSGWCLEEICACRRVRVLSFYCQHMVPVPQATGGGEKSDAGSLALRSAPAREVLPNLAVRSQRSGSAPSSSDALKKVEFPHEKLVVHSP